MTGLDQVRRMLAEVPYLQAHPGVSVTEVARAFGIKKRQVLADLDVLWMCGLPGGLPGDLIEIDMEAVQGEGIIRLTNAEVLSRPMRFTADEATSLIVALRAVEGLTSGATASAARRAAEKLTAIVPSSQAGRVGISLASGAPDMREQIATAVEGRSQLRLEYDNASRNETTHPVVDPVAIQVRDGVAYLCGWSLERDAWRSFRLDRIVTARPTGQKSSAHRTPPPVDDWFTQGSGQVTLDLAPQARWVVEYYPTDSVTELPGGALRATFPVGDPSWVSTMVLRLGEGVLHVGPPQAARGAAERAASALELNEQLGQVDA